MQLGIWKDKDTGSRAKLVKVESDCVWYVIPEFRGPQPCDMDTWLSSMKRSATGMTSNG